MDALRRRARARRAEICVVAILGIVLAVGLWQAYGVLLSGLEAANAP